MAAATMPSEPGAAMSIELIPSSTTNDTSHPPSPLTQISSGLDAKLATVTRPKVLRQPLHANIFTHDGPGALHASPTMYARFRAIYALVTLKVLYAGQQSPMANNKEQATTLNTNVGLLSALFLTIIVPNLFDATVSPQTNAYMVTEPAWLGQAYFATTFVSFLCLSLSTLGSVLVLIVLNTTSSDVEARYLFRMAPGELLMSVKMLVLAVAIVAVDIGFMLVIVSFGLNKSDLCSPNDCGEFVATFWIIASVSLMICLYYGWHVVNLVAKLYQARHKFADDDGEPRDDLHEVIIDINAKEVWSLLQIYFTVEGLTASSMGFKGFVARRTNRSAVGFSPLCDRLVDRLFEEKIAQLLNADHKRLVDEIQERAKQGLRSIEFCQNYPIHIEY